MTVNQACDLLGFSGAQLGTLLGVSKMAVSKWKAHGEIPQHYVPVILRAATPKRITKPMRRIVPPAEEISARCLALRDRIGLTQSELAEKLGLKGGKDCIWQWEAMKNRPQPRNWKKFRDLESESVK